MADRISVIIPVYNTGDRLSRCLDSMLAQSVRDLEIIAVNDGSTDNSPAICDEYARKDSRVKAIHMANGGVSAARNRGLEEATGTFVSFIDSDDWCEPWYIETFLSGMDDGVDLVLQGYVKERGEEEIDRRHLSDSTAAGEAIPACFLEKVLFSVDIISAVGLLGRPVQGGAAVRCAEPQVCPDYPSVPVGKVRVPENKFQGTVVEAFPFSGSSKTAWRSCAPGRTVRKGRKSSGSRMSRMSRCPTAPSTICLSWDTARRKRWKRWPSSAGKSVPCWIRSQPTGTGGCFWH